MAIFTGVLLWDLLAIATSIAAVGYAYIKWRLNDWDRKNVPSVDEKKLVENLDARDRILTLYNYAKSKGWKHFGARQVFGKLWVPVDLELIKCVITKDFNNFTDRGVFYNERDDPTSANIFNLEGKRWRDLRVKLTPVFTTGKLKAMFQTLVDCGLVMEEFIENSLTSTEAVDIKDILARFSTNVIGSVAFGIECNTFKDPDSPFRRIFQESDGGAAMLSYKIAAFSPTLARLLRRSTSNPKAVDFYTKVVSDTMEYRLKNNKSRKDFLQLLMSMRSKRDEQDGYADDGTLTMNEIVAQCLLFFGAGFETSSTTMTFALYHLSTRPDMQDRVREELRAVLERHDDQMTYDSLNEMTYLKQVIDETLRLFPALPYLLRVCVKDYKIPGENAVIGKGTKVQIPVWAPHHDGYIYKNPEEFDPERFSPENRKKIPQYAYMPFGEGPRVCIGERLGVMQTKVGLACLLRKFRVTLNEKTQLPLKLSKWSFTPSAEGGIWLDLERL